MTGSQLFYFVYLKGGAGVSGKSGSITFKVIKSMRSSTPSPTLLVDGVGGITIGAIVEEDSTNDPGTYMVGVDGLDPAYDYKARAHYTGTASDVDQVDTDSLRSEFSSSISAGALPQATVDADTIGLAALVWRHTTYADLTQSGSIGKGIYTGGFAPGANFGLPVAGLNYVAQTGDVYALDVNASGTLVSATSTTAVLPGGSSVNNFYNGCQIRITGGTGLGQTRTITQYVQSSKTVTVDRAWVTTPNNASTYAIISADAPKIDSSQRIAEVALVDTLTTYTGNTPQTGDTYAHLPPDFNLLLISSPSGAVLVGDIAADAISAAAISAAAAAKIATAVMDDTGDQATPATLGAMVKGINSMLTASGGNSTYTVDALKNAPSGGGGSSDYKGTAQGGTTTTIQLANTADASDNYYNGQFVVVNRGLLTQQSRPISSYNGTTKTITITGTWTNAPTNATPYEIVGQALPPLIIVNQTVIEVVQG